MAGGPIRIAVVGDTKDFQSSMGKAEKAMDDAAATAKTAGAKIDGAFDSTAEHADTVASKGSQAAGALGGLGDLIGGKFGTAMMAGGVAMQAAADAGDLLNVVTDSAIVRKIKDTAVTVAQTTATIAKTAADKAAAAAAKAWAAAQWLLNAALTANPIGLIVVALVGLVAGLVLAYKKCETFRDIVNAAFGAIMTVVKPVIEWLKTFIPAAFEVIKTAITTYVKIYLTVIKTVFNAIKSVVTGVWNAITNVTKNTFAGVKKLVTGPLDDVVGIVKGVPGKITALGSKFVDAGRSIIGKLVEGVKGAASFVGNIAGSIWNAMKGFINTNLIDRINNFLDFKISILGKDVRINAPDIPRLAQGGVTTGPTLAMIGDNPGGREAVIPLDKYDLSGREMTTLLQQILDALTGPSLGDAVAAGMGQVDIRVDLGVNKQTQHAIYRGGMRVQEKRR